MDLQQGDIFAIRGRGIAGWAVRNLVSPSTDRFHFGILWRKLADGDFIILESMAFGIFPKGICIGKFSQYYDVSKTEFYRVSCPKYLRQQAPLGLIDWGRSRYDYLLIAKFVVGGLLALIKILIVERKIRRLRVGDFPYGQNNSLICTEAADIAYDSVGVNLILDGVAPLPNAFKEAELEGRMTRIVTNGN